MPSRTAASLERYVDAWYTRTVGDWYLWYTRVIRATSLPTSRACSGLEYASAENLRTQRRLWAHAGARALQGVVLPPGILLHPSPHQVPDPRCRIPPRRVVGGVGRVSLAIGVKRRYPGHQVEGC